MTPSKRTIKAYACVRKGNYIPQNCDDPPFMCVFATEMMAEAARLKGEQVVEILITFPPPRKKGKKK